MSIILILELNGNNLEIQLKYQISQASFLSIATCVMENSVELNEKLTHIFELQT